MKEKIEELISLNEKDYCKYSKGCSNYIASFDNGKTLSDNIGLFE